MLDIEQYRKVYELLDTVTPMPYDCGSLCGSICCKSDPFSDGDSYIYLLPGEKEYLEHAGCPLAIEREDIREECHDLPASWGKYVYIARCEGPEGCDRRTRPIQCRTFPLTPHLNEAGELRMIYFDFDLPYVCPLIKEKAVLSDDFSSTVYEVWKILTEDKAIRDMVKLDSKKRRKGK